MVELTWPAVDQADAYRLMIYDRAEACPVFDEVVSGNRCVVTLPANCGNHDLAMRTRALLRGTWSDWSEFQPLPRDVILGERRYPSRASTPTDELGLLLLFTVDTECSILRQPNPNPERVVDELIFGDFGGHDRPGGIGLHMDLLEHFGYRGCFFLDILMEYRFGRKALERVVQAIATRGHEIQLHVHADHLGCSSDRRIAGLADALGAADGDAFRRVIELSIELFEHRVGHRPIAYRAGGYRVADAHFPVLAEAGIRIDSSIQAYYNSRVSDWMRIRTQPFWIDDVLEIPPTLILLNEHSDAWETRGFLPNWELGDPVSTLPRSSDGLPRVATYVSHSFQLLRCRQTSDPMAVKRFEMRLRSALSTDATDPLLRFAPDEVRTFGDEVDERMVAPVAGLLRRIADRPDARCVTYAEIAELASHYWDSDRQAPLDPIPLLDRKRGITDVSAVRLLGREFLTHLTHGVDGPESSERPGVSSGGQWIENLEEHEGPELRETINAFMLQLESDEVLRVRLRTLGVGAAGKRGSLPPLAELLFPADAVSAVADEVGVDVGQGVAWDAQTFLAWFEHQGLEVVRARRFPRGPAEMAAIDRFATKLKWLDPTELRTGRLEVELRRATADGREIGLPVSPLSDWSAGTLHPTATFGSSIDPESLPAVAADLYELTPPGRCIRLRLVDGAVHASRTTVLLAMMRAGFEVLSGRRSDYRLVRPVDLTDIRRFAGVH